MHQIVTANTPKATERAQSTRTLTFPQHLKHTCHKLIRVRRVRRRVEQHKLSLLRSTGTLKVSVLNFPCSSLPVGIWPETFPAADRRSRSPRVREKSVSMFHNVAVRWVWKLFPPSPPPKVLSFSPPRVSQSCPPSSTFRRGASECVYYSCCRGGFSRPILASLRVLSFRFLRALVDTTLCFTRSEGARATERRRGRVGGRERTADSAWRHEAGAI